MSFNDDLYTQSETRKIIAERDKLRVDLWPDQETEQSLWCPVCRVKLRFQDNGRTLWCKECGKHTPSTEVKHEKRLRSKFPKSTSGNPIVISQPKKSKREKPSAVGVNANLSEEDLKELRQMGFMI